MLIMPELWMEIASVLILSALLSVLAYRMELLTKGGSIASAAVGIVIGACGSLSWLILLIIFTVLGFVATLMGLNKKKEKGLQEGTRGERGYRNVLGVSIPCCIIAAMNFLTGNEYYHLMTIGYISTIAVAAADTAASEIGVKDQRVYLITNLKRVAPGTDGGVSALGSAISLVASITVTVIGWGVINLALNDVMILLPMLSGFIGCMLDSVVGATLETWGYLDKYGNNCVTGTAGGIIAMLLASVL